MSQKHLFLFGNTPALSRLELQAVLPGIEIETVNDSIGRVDLSDDQDPVALIAILGGTIKIFKQYAVVPVGTSKEDIESQLVDLLADDHDFRTFAVAEIGRDHLEQIEASELKAILKARNINTRYIDGSRHGLSSAILSHQKVKEMVVIQTAEEVLLAETVTVQDIDAWTLRDRGKPYADRKKGMLPPKVARMMLNLAIGAQAAPGSTVLDPFSGSGTILIEALERGLTNVIGNDLDAEAARGARENLDWYKNYTNSTAETFIYNQDATNLKLTGNKKVEYLVTEPFLGKPKPQPDQLANIFKGLNKLYLGAFKHWRTLLEDGAKVVCVFPAIIKEHTPGYPEVNMKDLIDKLAEFGYTTTSEVVVYHRPQAVVSRQIYQFVYKSK